METRRILTSASQFTYESTVQIITADDYFLKIKAQVEHANNSTDQIQSVINSISTIFFKSLKLFDALDMLENSENEVYRKYHQNVIKEGNQNDLSLTKFVLITLDAVQKENDGNEIKIELDPKLEGQKKKSGLMGRLFGKK